MISVCFFVSVRGLCELLRWQEIYSSIFRKQLFSEIISFRKTVWKQLTIRTVVHRWYLFNTWKVGCPWLKRQQRISQQRVRHTSRSPKILGICRNRKRKIEKHLISFNCQWIFEISGSERDLGEFAIGQLKSIYLIRRGSCTDICALRTCKSHITIL